MHLLTNANIWINNLVNFRLKGSSFTNYCAVFYHDVLSKLSMRRACIRICRTWIDSSFDILVNNNNNNNNNNNTQFDTAEQESISIRTYSIIEDFVKMEFQIR